MRRLLTVLLAVALTSTSLVPVGPAHAAEPAPVTVPALRNWTAATGSFTFMPSARIVVDGTAPSLDDEAATFAEDLAALTGTTIPVVHAPAGNLRQGDLFLALGSADTALGDEGYSMTVTGTVRIQARTDAG